MTALSTQGSTFTFGTSVFTVTSVSVDAPQPEIINITPITADPRQMWMVYTGDYVSPGRISIEAFSRQDPIYLIGVNDTATFSMPGSTSISRLAICDSANVEARVGDVFRVRMTFTPTDANYVPLY